jgi:activator of HSP90 ATPase
MKTISFRQQITLNAAPETVYDYFMDASKHSIMTGAEASVSDKVGGLFSVYDGYAHGRNIELVPGKRIIQSWRAAEKEWPEDHYSEIRFDFESVAKNKTRVVFRHRLVPEALADRIRQGWTDYYWSPLKSILNCKE